MRCCRVISEREPALDINAGREKNRGNVHRIDVTQEGVALNIDTFRSTKFFCC